MTLAILLLAAAAAASPPALKPVERDRRLRALTIEALAALPAGAEQARFLRENPRLLLSVRRTDPLDAERLLRAGGSIEDQSGLLHYDPFERTVFIKELLIAEIGHAPARLGEHELVLLVDQLAPALNHEMIHARIALESPEPPHLEGEIAAAHAEASFLAERLRERPSFLVELSPALARRYARLHEIWRAAESPKAFSDLLRRPELPSLFDQAAIAGHRAQLAREIDELRTATRREPWLRRELESRRLFLSLWSDEWTLSVLREREQASLERIRAGWPLRLAP